MGGVLWTQTGRACGCILRDPAARGSSSSAAVLFVMRLLKERMGSPAPFVNLAKEQVLKHERRGEGNMTWLRYLYTRTLRTIQDFGGPTPCMLKSPRGRIRHH